MKLINILHNVYACYETCKFSKSQRLKISPKTAAFRLIIFEAAECKSQPRLQPPRLPSPLHYLGRAPAKCRLFPTPSAPGPEQVNAAPYSLNIHATAAVVVAFFDASRFNAFNRVGRAKSPPRELRIRSGG